jgi:hypothetical protein
MSRQDEEAVAVQQGNPRYYLGIDFACQKKRFGKCVLSDDGETLLLDFQDSVEHNPTCIAVDCPFGTSCEFLDVLNGKIPVDAVDESLATRATERWIREYVSTEYNTARMWNESARKVYGREHYFHTTTHVQPTIAMRIVPKCLYWLLTKEGERCPSRSGLDILQDARRGTGRIIEAHPRMFLYSAIEKQCRRCRESVTREVLFNVAEYKNHEDQRRFVYCFLQQNVEWLHPRSRRLMPEEPPIEILRSDHAFDAFLSALLAWSHKQGMTIRWDQTTPPLSEVAVVQEGHILVLRQTERA